jgi:PiT family inorganic phosphate transporter
MIELIPFIASALIAFSIGSNDTSNAFGISIGCGTLSFKKAIYLLGFLVLLGALLQGQRVMKTVGSDLVDVNIHILSLSLLVSSIAIIISNWKKLPVSSHQAIVGSLVGSGAAFGASVDFVTLTNIVQSWLISPIGAFFLSVLSYKTMERTLSKLPMFEIEKYLRRLLLVAGAMIAYNTGANELATALGPVVYYGLLTPTQAAIIGAFLIWLGAMLLSGRVIETVGKGITSLDAFSGFAAQFGAGVSVLIFTSFGMPVSTTYCIIGGIAGVGVLKGVGTVKTGLLKKILASWVLTPLSAFLICYLIGKLIG